MAGNRVQVSVTYGHLNPVTSLKKGYVWLRPSTP